MRRSRFGVVVTVAIPVAELLFAPGERGLQSVALRPLEDAPAGARRLVDADSGQTLLRSESLFSRIAAAARQAVLASMIAYLFAQFVDVWLFHFWKRLTRGRHLWLRNNGSTMVSQLVDTVCVVLITFWAAISSGEVSTSQVGAWIAGGYSFKLLIAALDTIPFYLAVRWLAPWLSIDPMREHDADDEGITLDDLPPAARR